MDTVKEVVPFNLIVKRMTQRSPVDPQQSVDGSAQYQHHLISLDVAYR